LDKLTRKELKTDRFVQEVSHSLEYVSSHRAQAKKYGVLGLAVLVVAAGTYFFVTRRAAQRQSDLAGAFHVRAGIVGGTPQPGDPRPVYKDQAEKDTALGKAFANVASAHPGTNEASVAHYQLGVLASDAGRLDEAEKQFRAAMNAGDANYSSVARHSLAQVLSAKGKHAEAEKLLRELIDNPSLLVSKEQATFTLARVYASSKPAEARKLVEPLMKDTRPTIARNAEQLMGELPFK
jgi:tetratricopeptide (TPR) repeat protein